MFTEVLERLVKLELASAERDLLVLDTAEKVASKLAWRQKKRQDVAEPELDEIDRLIAIRRGARDIHGG